MLIFRIYFLNRILDSLTSDPYFFYGFLIIGATLLFLTLRFLRGIKRDNIHQIEIKQITTKPSDTSVESPSQIKDKVSEKEDELKINYFSNENITWTEEQLAILNASPNKIITGCAGSGKTLLVINLAQKLSKKGKSVCIIIYTKSLRTFIVDFLKKNNVNNVNVFYEREWFYKDPLKYDFCIIDEFQDFSLEEIKNIISYATIGSYIFGDEEQEIYGKRHEKVKTVTTNELLGLEKFEILQLTKNFRVPQEITEFVNSIYKLRKDKKDEEDTKIKFSLFRQVDLFLKKSLNGSGNKAEKPSIIRFNNYLKELEWISTFLENNNKYSNVGILLKCNEDKIWTFLDQVNNQKVIIPGIIFIKDYLDKNNIKCGYKHRTEDCLDFKRERSINILTIHSAKGLEFDCVIIPFCNEFNNNINDNLPYVAYTRSRSKLIITYSDKMAPEIYNANRNTYTFTNNA